MKIALIGNQNSGKTTLFNCLTGMNSKIGNWPGVTIEKKTGVIKNTKHEIIDLPGIYALSPYTIEEEVSRKYIFEENPDVIINIIDATSLERSLYLTTQLLELDIKIVVALNMADVLEKKGITIDIEKLGKELGVRVVKISALKEIGIDELIQAIDSRFEINHINIFDKNIENVILNVQNKLNNRLLHMRFICVKILEQDNRFKIYIKDDIEKIVNDAEKIYNTSLEEIIATQRYIYIENVKKECVTKKEVYETISDKLDKIFLNKWVAFPLFALIMFLIYYLSVGVIGKYTVNSISNAITVFKQYVDNVCVLFNISDWINSLIVDGIISGIGSVLSFVPQLVLLFICISILETSGYMSRVALILDKSFRKIGLSGKSLIPFIVGSGCSVPGIMSSRIIENDNQKNMTVILTPFIPCSAKLPIISLFAGYFFPQNSGVISVSIYFFAIIVIILSAYIMKKFVYKDTFSTYVSELPEYRLPSIKYIAKDVYNKVLSFLKRAGSVILICSVIMWFLLSFSCDMKYCTDIQNSIIANIGSRISWIFTPMIGTNSWEATVSAIQGLVAKEQVVSSMTVIAGISGTAQLGNEIFSNKGIFSFFTPISAYAFTIFNLFSAPCFGAIAAMKKELGGTKKVLKAIAFQTMLAWCLATIVYQIGSKMELAIFNLGNILAITLIAILSILAISLSIKGKGEECRRCAYSKSCHKKII